MTTIPERTWKTPNHSVTPSSDERLIEALNTHWIKFVAPLSLYVVLGMICIIVTLSFGAAGGNNPLTMSIFLGFVLLLTVVHHWSFNRILSEGMVDLMVTNKRIIYLESHLWFQDQMHEIALGQLQGVQAHKHGILQNLLRYGDLWFDTGGSEITKNRTICRIPHPHRVARTIMQLLEMK